MTEHQMIGPRPTNAYDLTQPMKLPRVDPKEVIHYYVDGGVKNGMIVSAFVRKGFRMKPKSEVRRSYKSTGSSTQSEKRAITLAVEDAVKEGYRPEQVCIHTDQKPFVFNQYKRVTDMSLLRADLIEQGYRLAYLPSTHNLDGLASDRVPKKLLNALAVHSLVKETLASGHNRYRHHLNQKRKARKARSSKV